MKRKTYFLSVSGALLIALVFVFISSQTKPSCTPVKPEEPICKEASDCEGLPHIMCVGEWQCIDGKCVWKCGLPKCYKEGEKFMGSPEGKCCEGLKPVFDCFETEDGGCICPTCPCYVCTKCGDGICGKGENKCNCPEDCYAIPTKCKALKPGSYGMCEMVLGWIFDGKDCVLESGCSCKPDCDYFFKTKQDCMKACGLVIDLEKEGKPCNNDEFCGYGMKCLPKAITPQAEKVCMIPCSYDEECPEGYFCFTEPVVGVPINVCKKKKCVVSGCNGEICAEKPMSSICLWKPEYACLKYSECGLFGPNEKCAWKQTPEYLKCLEEVKLEELPTKQSQCEGNAYGADPCGEVKIWTEGNKIFIHHTKVPLNCCAQIQMKLKKVGNNLEVIETIKEPYTPCKCICLFTLESYIENLPSGEYHLTLWTDDKEKKCFDSNIIVGETSCYKEGEVFIEFGDVNPDMCCGDSFPVLLSEPVGGKCVYPKCMCWVCVNCGNGKCGPGENYCTCPKDCKK